MTLSFNYLGNLGHQGNQMFQYATLFALSKRLGVDAVCPHENMLLPECFDLSLPTGWSTHTATLREKDFSYDPTLNSADKEKDHDIYGYFQSEKYFEDYRDEIKKEFTFKDEIKENAYAMKSAFGLRKTVSVHVRRGDYVSLQHTHPLQETSYYEKALEQFVGYTPVIFSDDINWCKQNFSLDNCLFSPYSVSNERTGSKAFEEMCLMSMCEGHIMCNSSFSWWASWLSGKKTVAPAKWFGLNGPKNWSDVYLKEWIVI